jgi:anaerobic selenocysteine-containing dehydrogenase
MGIINASRGNLAPVSRNLLSEPAIVCRLARAVLGVGRGVRVEPRLTGTVRPTDNTIPWSEFESNYDLVRERIERVVAGFERYNARVREGCFYLPNAPRDRREWRTKTKKANFVVAPIPRPELGPGEFILMTVRSHDQFNTTIYGLDDRYRGVFGGRRVVFMNEQDISAAGLRAGQLVDLTNRHGGAERVAPAFMVAPYRLPRGCVAAYFPEANVLVPIDSVAAVSNTPASKYVIVTIASSPASAYPRLGLTSGQP